MSRRTTIKRFFSIDFAAVVGASEQLQAHDRLWQDLGYSRAGARGWACSDGSYSMRLTWRRDRGSRESVTYTVKGLRS